MKISDIGEFGLIDRLAKMADSTRDDRQAAWQWLTKGIGDDAAAWQGDDKTQLATIDSMIEGVHFTWDTLSWADLGWKALAVNLSDIAAMGGQPRNALVSLALPGDTELDDVTALYQGMLELASQTGVAIVGGDTCQAPLVAVTIALFGVADEAGILTRSAARPGELVAVTGYLGTAAAGLEMLQKNLKLNRETADLLLKNFGHPQPRIAEGQALLEGGVKAAIDISDGLLADLGHVCQQSQVGARTEIDRLPLNPLVRAAFGERAFELALDGGEDYELLFTAGAEVIDKIRKTLSCPVTVIGEITTEKAGEITLLDSQGKPVAISHKGWEHFQDHIKPGEG